MAFSCTPNLITQGPLASSEIGSALRSHTTSYLIEGLASDFGTTTQAPLNVLTADIDDLPVPGERMVSAGTHELFVTGRNCRMEAPTLAIVDVSWQQFETSLNNALGISTNHDVGIKTVTTSRAQAGEPFEVRFDGNTQSPSITVMDPEPVYSVELVIDMPGLVDPVALSEYYVGKTNSTTWRNYAEGTWLCTAANPRPLSVWQTWGARRYVFAFRFVASAYGDGWQPTIEWIASPSHMPPSGLEDGIGRKWVQWYQGADFNIEPQSIADGLRST